MKKKELTILNRIYLDKTQRDVLAEELNFKSTKSFRWHERQAIIHLLSEYAELKKKLEASK